MAARWSLLILVVQLSTFFMVMSDCPRGFSQKRRTCIDYDECSYDPGPCGMNTVCHNTNGSFYCQCADGFTTSTGTVNISASSSEICKDIDECLEDRNICGPNARCRNTVPYYYCTCNEGFNFTTGVEHFNHSDNVTCRDINECQSENICGQNAKCINTLGSYFCICNADFEPTSGKSNFSVKKEKCEELNCDVFKDINNQKEKFPVASDLVMKLRQICLELTSTKSLTASLDEDILKLRESLSAINKVLSSGFLSDNRKVSNFLDIVENALRLIGPFIKTPRTKISSNYTELELLVHSGPDLPQGAVTLSSRQVQVHMNLETAAGDPSDYPGFTTLSLLSYANLEDSADGFFVGMKPQKNQRFQINSKVVTVTVSNRNTSLLKEPVKITFHHLKQSNESHTCAFWDSSQQGGTWSARGCSVVESNSEYTVCSCTHLSSFAVLMALYEMENKFELQVITWVGLSLSLICLFICILTFLFIHSIQSPRTTIHLHLCINLFIANRIFLAGVSRTENQVGCAVVAGLLHFFNLVVFSWMCLEGIQLFRMVVLVFNTNFKTAYMMAGGYGVPAVIVTVTALANSKAYGTLTYCWLNLEFIWSLFFPACVIITINIFFILITVWKLAQKLSSSNPDLDNLHKVKAFTITAAAQLCVLGTTWVFECFQFVEGTIATSYLFTIFGSLQGVMLFIIHCLFCKQVREVYGNILFKFCAPLKSSYRSSATSAAKHMHEAGPGIQESLTFEEL
ncbi:adhesion G protein-coupled receptor E1-like [Anabas testudineus]|uniref:Si:ch211-241f5.3 n=1 Tax=Anabas testudineus TaxID=64144 RepID=A0A3Q1KFS3_ANATE|nr:adhesion G protein-coupled receptor E1-like [Anabas testudineus]